MRFDFLYDRRRRIFSIGYRLADAEGPGRLDAAFYDLLASEARLASFVAIAKGDVPQHHWFHLGRLVTNVDGRATLMSWGGTMFEYLMPLLLMRNFPGTLLDQSCRASVRRQIDYGRQRDVPWGISESAYAFTDRAGNYQYRAFGVPGLGLKRGLADRPRHRAVRHGAGEPRHTGGRGRELRAARARWASKVGSASTKRSITTLAAATSTRRRQPIARPAVVRAYFAHHQGMSLVALANVICERCVRLALPRGSPRPGDRAAAPGARAARGDPVGAAPGREHDGAAVASRVRVETLPIAAHDERAHALPLERALHRRRSPTPAAASACGATSRSPGGATIRTSDAGAHFIYLRDPWSSRVWSATYQPVCQEPDEFEATFDLDKITFRRRDSDIETQLEITVSSEDDVEVRRLSITNRGDADARDRGHQLRGDRAGSSRGRPRAPGVRQAVRRDGVRSAERRPPVQPPAARGRRIADRRLPRAGRRRAPPGRRRRVGDGPRALPRPRTLARQPDRPRRPRAVGHNGRGARSDRRAARAHPAGARRRRPRDLCHRCCAGSSRRAGAGAKVPRRERRRARLLDGVHPRAHHAAAPGTQRRARDALRSPRVACLWIRRVVHQPGRPRAATRSVSRTCGATASPGTCRSCSSASRTRRRCRSRASCSTHRSTGASRACALTSSS